MFALMAVVLFDLSPNLCDDIRSEMEQYKEMGGKIEQVEIDRIVKSCRDTWEKWWLMGWLMVALFRRKKMV